MHIAQIVHIYSLVNGLITMPRWNFYCLGIHAPKEIICPAVGTWVRPNLQPRGDELQAVT